MRLLLVGLVGELWVGAERQHSTVRQQERFTVIVTRDVRISGDRQRVDVRMVDTRGVVIRLIARLGNRAIRR